ncbi:lipopolysaccharide biosynthesis protein [Sphingomonas montanisoli]|uniref:Lipopolysaccharide biosynthesis protein n=1 Tax=Sphingomonas montanisoli TaxID=2606412 RepID=A0A5D9CCX2_9SPHN|nr:lipopolysaccharide biosynthesis protein [Sphingomonas montanisoli]TZG27955.1 lipopolysaccharide biosynthesis protein [Sphingomonas montanisoli]
MHGIIKPLAGEHVMPQPQWHVRAAGWARKNWAFVAVVILPSALAAFYYGLVASNQYESEAHFLVRSTQSSPAVGGGIGALLSFGGAAGQPRGDAMSVIEYLQSTEAVAELDRRIGLIGRFRRDGVDIVSRIRATPTPESLVKYYRKHITLRFDDRTGITELSVRAFSPADSRLIAETSLRMGEERVNLLNERSYRDSLMMAARQLDEAENNLRGIQVRLTKFRQVNNDIDPEGSGRAQISLLTQLTTRLAEARAELMAMRGSISPTSPQYVALANRVRSLDSQIAAQRQQLAGGTSAIAANLGNFEDLRIRQEFAAKRYEAAAASYQAAREEARKKQLYVVRVVNPNLPVKSLYPERTKTILTVFFSLLVAYAIFWFMRAGVKEHVNH